MSESFHVLLITSPSITESLFLISDYESLRIGGLVFAVVLFLLGIALIVSKWFASVSTQQMCNVKCRFSPHCDPSKCELTSQPPECTLRKNKPPSVCLRRLVGRRAQRLLAQAQHSLLMLRVSQQLFIHHPFSHSPCPSMVLPCYLPTHTVTARGSPETKTNH